MHVLATAGHVDHGKSTLVHALTGTDPDRWEEEHRRGLTIDLGYVWTTLPGIGEVAFVDVPGHSRFIGNMLAGLGPAPGVVFVVAADGGWSAQSEEHLAAVDALGIRHGVLVVTRSDLADPRPAMAEGAARIGRSSLGDVAGVAVSAVTGTGLAELRRELGRLVHALPRPDPSGRVRLWVDRSFTVKGAGTVVTGTLGAGTVRVGDTLELRCRPVTVRGVQSLERECQEAGPVSRVALNLRGVEVRDVTRGDVLLSPSAWPVTDTVDVRLTPLLGGGVPEVPGHLSAHVGTAALPVRVRPLDAGIARLRLPVHLPVAVGDRIVLRDPGGHRIVGGALVLDADPPELVRRGAARARARALREATGRPDLLREVSRRGSMRRERAEELGVDVEAALTDGATASAVVSVDGWLVHSRAWLEWCASLAEVVARRRTVEPLDPALPLEEARQRTGIPDLALVHGVAAQCGLEVSGGRVHAPGVAPSLGDAEAGLRVIEERLRTDPFAAPERPDLEALGLGPRQMAAAAATGRVVRLADDVVLLPDAPASALRVLAELPQPFTTSEARRALGSTRRVVIPLLEHLDERGWTRRLDPGHREVVTR